MESLELFVEELRNSLPIPKLPKRMVFERVEGTLYNIHKRSMPVGVDRLVIMGVTEDGAETEINRLVAKEVKRRERENTETVFYFDVVPMECNEIEKSIYYNDCQTVL